LRFTRADPDTELLCLFNLSDTATTAALPAGDWRALDGADPGPEAVRLGAWGHAILKRSGGRNG
jgi:alpha-glucosidase